MSMADYRSTLGPKNTWTYFDLVLLSWSMHVNTKNGTGRVPRFPAPHPTRPRHTAVCRGRARQSVMVGFRSPGRWAPGYVGMSGYDLEMGWSG